MKEKKPATHDYHVDFTNRQGKRTMYTMGHYRTVKALASKELLGREQVKIVRGVRFTTFTGASQIASLTVCKAKIF